MTPALHTQTSMRPSAAATSATARSAASGSPMSTSDDVSAPTERADLRHRVRRVAALDETDVGAEPGERDRDRPPDAPARSGDERDLAGEELGEGRRHAPILRRVVLLDRDPRQIRRAAAGTAGPAAGASPRAAWRRRRRGPTCDRPVPHATGPTRSTSRRAPRRRRRGSRRTARGRRGRRAGTSTSSWARRGVPGAACAARPSRCGGTPSRRSCPRRSAGARTRGCAGSDAATPLPGRAA